MISERTTLVLSGPPGVGKSTVARALGPRRGTHVDLDEDVARRLGMTPADIIRTRGEPALRSAEAEALAALPSDLGVLALGGGTLTTRRGRELSRAQGPVVSLELSAPALAERLATSPVDRPLIGNLEDLLVRRRASYLAVDASVSATGDVDEVAHRTHEATAEARVLSVPVGDTTTRVVIGRGLAATATAGAVAHLAPRRPIVVVVDRGAPTAEPVVQHLLATFPGVRVDVEGGEPCKAWPVLGDVLACAVSGGAGRQSVVVGIGGGAVCDLAGLTAALLGRGAELVLVPTTVLAQADAAIGGKCAVNVAGQKNLAGTFYPAHEVVIDVALTATQTVRDRAAGLAEVLKAGVIGAPSLVRALGEAGDVDVSGMAEALAVKARIVAQDPEERGLRKVLNLGHTLGHALEAASGLTLRHGEAVAMGLMAAARVSHARGLTDTHTVADVQAAAERCGLPTAAPRHILKEAAEYLRHDKKGTADTIELILIRRIGEVCVVEVPWTDATTELLLAGGGV
jgi:shikimate kinase/3-dehydroquinate synthase